MENKNTKKTKYNFNLAIVVLIGVAILAVIIYALITRNFTSDTTNTTLLPGQSGQQEIEKLPPQLVNINGVNFVYLESPTQEEINAAQQQYPDAEIRILDGGDLKELMLRSEPDNPNWELENTPEYSDGITEEEGVVH